MAKLRTPTAPNAVKDEEQQERSLLVGMGDADTLEDRLAVSYKTKVTMVCQCRFMNCEGGEFPRGVSRTYLGKLYFLINFAVNLKLLF
jgi:hypothetical protein